MNQHHCDAAVVCCIDFRFQKFIRSWLDQNMKGKTYDLVGFAGATKNLEAIMQQIKISKKLHCINQVILVHHEDCGAYGNQSTSRHHIKDLKRAKKRILADFPDLKVDLYYLHLNGKFDKIK